MEVVVVIPTRNRAELVTTTIASALAEDDSRLRVLVSDNSTDAQQSEQLSAWCAARPEERLTYARPPRPLPMSAHWQWALDRALADATTTHVLYLTDRLILRPDALAELLAIVEQHPSDVVTYGDDVIIDHEQPVTLFERAWTGQLLRVDSEHMLRLAARGISLATPAMLNCIVPRSVFEDIAKTYGSVFASIAPDHCFSNRCLDRVDSFLHCDRPLIIQRALWRSNGFSQIRGVGNADHADFLGQLGDGGINASTPVPALLTVTNAIYNEYEFVRKEPASSKLKPLRRHFYLGANARDVARLEDPALQARMRSVLAEHGWSRWTRLRYVLGLSLSAAGYYGPRPRALVRRLIRKAPPAPGFADSAQALDYTLNHPRSPSEHADHLWPLMSRPGVTRALSYTREDRESGPRTGLPTRERTTAGS
jgi:hypothetical protein